MMGRIFLSTELCRAEEAPPFDDDPILDVAPQPPSRERVVQWTQGASGFRIGSFGGISTGSAASYLSPRISSLDRGTFPLFGLSLGYRLGSDQNTGILRRFELDLSTALGFGRTFEKGDYDDALDLHIRPGLSFYILEGQRWAMSANLTLNTIIFDLEGGEVSQIAIGPATGGRITWKLSDLSQLYLQLSWSPVYDILAYSFRDPTEEELEDNPEIKEIKVKGEWFNHYQLVIGMRLLGF